MQVCETLAVEYSSSKFVRVNAEEDSTMPIVEKYEVMAVPYFVFLQGEKVLAKMEGADVPALVELAKTHLPKATPDAPVRTLRQEIESLLKQEKVMLFMKVRSIARGSAFFEKS